MFKKLIALKYAVPVAALLVTGSAGAVVYNVAANTPAPNDTVQPLTSPGSTEISPTPTASPDAAGTPEATATPGATVPAAGKPTGTPAPALPMYSHTAGNGYCLIRSGDDYIEYHGEAYYKGKDFTTNGCAPAQAPADRQAAPVTPDPTPTPAPCDCNVTNPNTPTATPDPSIQQVTNPN